MRLRIAVARDRDVLGHSQWRWVVFFPAQDILPRMRTQPVIFAGGCRSLRKDALSLARVVRAELRAQGVR
jgi:hypothetical protein